MPSAIRLIYHIGIITLAIVFAFVWLRSPTLSHYSVQLFGAVILIYFVIKKLNQADFWQLLPSPASLEMALATLAFLLVIGATGNIHSPLFPLSFVHLFFLTLSAQNLTTLVILFEIILFHYSLSVGMGTIETSYLASLPIVTGFFLLAKDQFVKVFKQKASIAQVVNITKTVDTIRELQKVDQALENILGNLLSPQAMTEISQARASQDIQVDLTTTASADFEFSSPEEPVVNLSEFETELSKSEPVDPELTAAMQIEFPPVSPDLKVTSERVAEEILDSVKQTKT